MLSNENLFLRPSSTADAPLRYQWFNDPEFTKLYLGRPATTSYRQIEEEIGLSTSSPLSTGLFELSIRTAGDNFYIGNTFFRKIDWQNRSAEYGIFLGPQELWGRKTGTEVTRMMLQYGFDEFGFHRIWLTVFSYNFRAIKCFEKCGFEKEGLLRHVIFSGGQFNDVILMSIIKGSAF
ncbi:MAG: Spermidine N(1)-acetyltransferase [Smithella sp. PtaU1.Bin162]|nr:MAG: Spermidine N(1)-acetyltransferase [Smithella sp. PtaU1.Bin162]